MRGWAQRLPRSWQQSLRRIYYGRQIRRGRFASDEPEFALLPRLLNEGDVAIDIGANVGTYTLQMSKLVGPTGRVFAFEPTSETFELLTSNVQRSPNRNVSLFNTAVSAEAAFADLSVRFEERGYSAYYKARIVPAASVSTRSVFCCPIDSFAIPRRVALLKIDVEGHEVEVVKGMLRLLERDLPAVIVEGDKPELNEMLTPLGLTSRRISESTNRLFATTETFTGLGM